MKTTTLILIALFTTACSTWTPRERVVTLHDVEPELAETEGADLRYQVSEAPQCDARSRGCRDVTSEAAEFETYRWEALCDARFCGADELAHVDLIREAARIAFTSEQIVAAIQVANSPETSESERARLLAFARRASEDMRARIDATESALRELPATTFAQRALQKEANEAVRRAERYLQRARTAMAAARRLDSSGLAVATWAL